MDLQRVVQQGGALVVLLLAGLNSGSAQTSTEGVVLAANGFLATLSEAQRQKVVYRYEDSEQRVRWSNFPTGMVRRGGISLKEMSSVQQNAALALLKTVLSPMGYEKVNRIRMADDDFKVNGAKKGPPGGALPGRNGGPPSGPGGLSQSGPGGPPPGDKRSFTGADLFGGDLYYISFLGMPSATTPWMLQFGGHHLALNITIAGHEGVMTPTLTGAQPAMFAMNGKTIRPLGAESDKASALLQSLDASQRRRAILNYRVADLVLGPGQDAKKIAPEGLEVASMNDKQRYEIQVRSPSSQRRGP
jgi:Protein of unknown function (DUF3500)